MNILKNKWWISMHKHSKSGFGLAEALVSMGILGVVIVGLLSQQRLSVKGSMNAASDNEINNITKRVIAEIGVQGTCSITGTPTTGNFKGRRFTDAIMQDMPNLIRTNGTAVITKNAVYGTGQGQVYVDNIKAIQNPKNDNEMLLTLSFRKKVDGTQATLLNRFTNAAVTREIPLTIVRDTVDSTIIDACFGNYDLIVRTAIQLACQGPGSIYRADQNPPYGDCYHQTTPIGTCPNGKFLKTVAATATTPVTYTCESLSNACPAGQFITEFKSDGSITCETAYKKCAAGSILLKNSAGQYVCSTIDCENTTPPVKAFSGFDANGTQICNQVPTFKNCGATNFATQVNNDGSVECNNAVVQAGSCPLGSFIQGINSAGAINCVPWIKLNTGCPGGYAISGVDAAGNLQCKLIRRPLACDGTQQSHTYQDCRNAGGSIAYANTGNSQCIFSGASCPGGWNRCYSFGSQLTTSCPDITNTYYCNTGATRYAYATLGNWGYGNDAQDSTPCYSVNGYPGTGYACYWSVYATIYSQQVQVGCY